MERDLLKMEKLFEQGRISDLGMLLNNVIMDFRQQKFEKYIKKGTFNVNTLVPCLYGTLDGQMVFTNHHSLYIMNRPFVIDRGFINSIKKNTIARIIKPEEATEEKLLEFIQMVKEHFGTGSLARFDENTIGDKFYTISNRFNEVTFDSDYLFEMLNFLGYNTQFKLSDLNPVLYGESAKGKAYVLGLKRRTELEVRRFNIPSN